MLPCDSIPVPMRNGNDNDTPSPCQSSIDDNGRCKYIWEVHKFGGTSVASAPLLLKVSSIISQELSRAVATSSFGDFSHNQVAVVVSAMGGKPKSTDLLLGAVAASADRQPDLSEKNLTLLYNKHRDCLIGDPDGKGPSPLRDLLPEGRAECLLASISRDLDEVRDILRTVGLMRWKSDHISGMVSGYGEIWNAKILAEVLEATAASARMEANGDGDGDGEADGRDPIDRFFFVDARTVVTMDEKADQILWEESTKKWTELHVRERRRILAEHSKEGVSNRVRVHPVITGYVASTASGVPTTLGRDGSDFTAAIFGRILSSDKESEACMKVCIWTDVDGVLSADPRRVPNVRVLPEVSYAEAMELAYFGAKVIHPKTMGPVMKCSPQVPIYIRNTFNPDFVGSRIFVSGTGHANRDRCVAGFSSVENIGIVDVEGTGMVGVPGMAHRIFAAVHSLGVSIILIAQASSEHSITIATTMEATKMIKEALEQTFSQELKLGKVSCVRVVGPCSIIAAVGDGMSHTTGVSGRFFSALGDAKINVMAVAQGCTERNISAVVETSQSTRALRAVHAAFHLSHTYVRVGIVGGDTELGYALLGLLEAQRDKLRIAFDLDLQVCVVHSSDPHGMVILKNDDGRPGDGSITTMSYNLATGTSVCGGLLGPAVDDEARQIEGEDLSNLVARLISDACAHTVIFDCTADAAAAAHHASWLNHGVHVVTANNMGISGPKDVRDAIDHAERRKDRLSGKYLPEVAAAGGLPVVSTLRSLLSSGDKIKRIDGIMSVSMSYIMFRVAPPPMVTECRSFDQEACSLDMPEQNKTSWDKPDACSFSTAVREAITLGLMEIDPSYDLSNEYTVRCLMVLAKELGLQNDGFDVGCIQAKSDSLTITEEIDAQMAKRVASAAKKGCVPRQVASIDVPNRSISVKIIDVPGTHIFAITPPSCEIVRFFTHRHYRYPLIIQGPAMGVDSTASALLAEVLHLMQGKIGIPARNLRKLKTTHSSAALV